MDEIALPALAPARAAATGDRARFERLWAEHYAAVHAYAARRLGPAAADEVCAEVFLTAWRRLDRVPADALPWLYGTARNVLGTRWRGDARRERLHARLEAEPSPGADVDGPLDGELSGALAELAERDRELVLLVYWEGLTPAQAATALGLAPATARTRLWRARRRLGRLLALEEESQ